MSVTVVPVRSLTRQKSTKRTAVEFPSSVLRSSSRLDQPEEEQDLVQQQQQLASDTVVPTSSFTFSPAQSSSSSSSPPPLSSSSSSGYSTSALRSSEETMADPTLTRASSLRKRKSPSPEHNAMRPPPAQRSPRSAVAAVKEEDAPEALKSTVSSTATAVRKRTSSTSSWTGELPSLGSVLSASAHHAAGGNKDSLYAVASGIPGKTPGKTNSNWHSAVRSSLSTASSPGLAGAAPPTSIKPLIGSASSRTSPVMHGKPLPLSARSSSLATLGELDRPRPPLMSGSSASRSSPPPRLPGFASLGGPMTHDGHLSSSSAAAYPPRRPGMPPMLAETRRVSSTPSYAEAVDAQPVPPPGAPLAAFTSQHGALHGSAAGTPYGASGLPVGGTAAADVAGSIASSSTTSPMQSAATASSYFGHPPIHPSLAGLPGAGGGPGSKQQPSFVCKLYTILEDPKISHMINWVSDGTAFRVACPTEFSRVVLPTYFKHANWQSFVRQLNMYGFHKVANANTAPTTVNAPNAQDDATQNQIWEFRHPNFRRGDIHLLSEIKRKSSRPSKASQQQQLAARGSVGASVVDDSGDNASSSSSGDAPMMMGASGAVQAAASEGYSSRTGGEDAVVDDQEVPRQRMHSYTDSPAHMYARASVPPSYPGSHPGPAAAASGAPATAQHYMHHEAHRPPFDPRLDDLSDRIDAIIRHSTYLESQLRSVSEQLRISQHAEQLTRAHSLEAFDRLARFCHSLHRDGERDVGAHEYRNGLLDAIQREMDQLHAITANSSAASQQAAAAASHPTN